MTQDEKDDIFRIDRSETLLKGLADLQNNQSSLAEFHLIAAISNLGAYINCLKNGRIECLLMK